MIVRHSLFGEYLPVLGFPKLCLIERFSNIFLRGYRVSFKYLES